MSFVEFVKHYPRLVFWAVAAVVGGLLSWWALVQSRRTAANLKALAQRLGLEFFEEKKAGWAANHVVTGQHDGREVIFHTFTTGSGKSRTTWRAVTVRPRAIGGLLFHFRPQGLVTKLEGLFGTKEITVGDATFDAAWFVETNEPDFLPAALVPEVRSKLMAAHATVESGGNFKLRQAAVQYAERGTFADANDCARFEQLLPVLHDLADIAEVSAERSP
jgi:hypothetical protein